MIRNLWRLDLSVNQNTKLNLIKAWMSTIDKVWNIIWSHTSDELNCSNHSILQAYHLGRYEPSFNATEELHAGQWCSAVGRAVASYARDLWSEYSHRKFYLLPMNSIIRCVEKTTIEKKEAVNGPLWIALEAYSFKNYK